MPAFPLGPDGQRRDVVAYDPSLATSGWPGRPAPDRVRERA